MTKRNTSVVMLCFLFSAVLALGGLLAEMKYDIHNYVFAGLDLPENKNHCVFTTLE